MNVFFLHGVSSFGGSTKSLHELYLQLKFHGIIATVLCPSGKSAESLSNAGMKIYSVSGIAQFCNTEYGYYRGLRWLILIRECVFLLPTVLALLRIKIFSKKFDIIHANEITLLPIAILAKKLFKCPLVVHVRSLQRSDSNTFRSRVQYHLLNKYADEVIAIDKTVKSTLPVNMKVNVIHNGINLSQFTKSLNARALPEVPRAGIVGMLCRVKGIHEFLEAARILLIDRGLKIQFVVVGENIRSVKGITAWIYKKLGFSEDTAASMLTFIRTHQLEKYFDIKGFVKDVRTIYSDLDILCFPSHLNATGRPIFEAGLFGIPSIVAVREPEADTIIDKQTGLCIHSPDPQLLANSIELLVKNPKERIRLGNNAKELASRYSDINKNAILVVEIYHSLFHLHRTDAGKTNCRSPTC